MQVLIIIWGLKKPSEAFLVDLSESKSHKSFTLWKKGSSKTIFEVLDMEQKLKDAVNDCDDLTILEYKKYYDYFGKCGAQDLFDFQLEYDDLKHAIKLIKERKSEFGEDWQRIRADAAEVYSAIEKRGILVDHKTKYPKYSMNVYSGRSKTTGFNVQGSNSDSDVRHPDEELPIFLRFDWIAADMRMASYLSEDEELSDSFNESDPYYCVEKSLDFEVDRTGCKILLNKAVNSLNDDDLVLKIFPTFADWIKKQKGLLKKNGYVESLLKKRFYTDHTLKGDRRAFNGTLQGSVAHAMQSTMSRVYRECGDIIVAEQHDSLTIATSERKIKRNIKTIQEIMNRPFNDDILMPLRIEIGKSWGVYKTVKEFR